MKITPHPLEDLIDIIDAIEAGNATQHQPAPARDLSFRKMEYWETRPHPVKLYHWKEAEFDEFLVTHDYPGNTFQDRRIGRINAITDALVSGQYVPPEVMRDPATAEAVADTVMKVRALFASHRKTEMQKQTNLQFEAGLTKAPGYEINIQGLIAQAAKVSSTAFLGGIYRTAATGKCKRLELPFLSMPVTVVLITPDDHTRHFNRRFWLSILDGRDHDQYAYAELLRIDLPALENHLRFLIGAGEISLDEALSLLPNNWALFTQVACIDSRIAA